MLYVITQHTCIQCFSSGAVAGGHERDHPYQLIVSDQYGLYSTCMLNDVYIGRREFPLAGG